MNRATIAELLELAERQVAEGAQRIAEQEARIYKLTGERRDISEAALLLRQFQEIQSVYLSHRDRLLRELATASGKPLGP